MTFALNNLLLATATQPAAPSGTGIDSALATIIAASIAAIVAIITCIITLRHNQTVLREMRQGEQRKRLQSALDDLLVPLYSQLMQMKGLFEIFKVGKPAGFRTLTYLLDPEHFKIDLKPVTVELSEADRKLLDEIVDLESRLEVLLVDKGSLVADSDLHKAYVPNPSITDVDPAKLKDYGLFEIAALHFRVMRLAYRGLLRDDAARYAQFIYPRELNDAVSKAIERTKGQLAKLDGK